MTQTARVTSIDEYIAAFPDAVRPVLEQVRRAIHHAAPEAVETISYAIPAFDLHGRHLVFFAGWKRHISLYPLPAGDAAFQQQIAAYKRARGSIQFPLSMPIPYDLVEYIVTLLMAEKPEAKR